MSPYVLACDCGTTSAKVLLLDGAGQVHAEIREEYAVLQEAVDRVEQRPAELWDAVARAIRRAVHDSRVDPSDVAGLVFAASWKGIVALDEEQGALGDAMIWLDARAGEQAAELNDRVGRYVGTGQEYWPRLMWLKQHEPELWSRADRIVGLNTYLKWRATGSVYTEPSDDLIHAPSPELEREYAEIVHAAGLDADRHKFPASRPPTDDVGALTESAARELGLTSRTRVFNGFGDLPAITVGAGCSGIGDTHIYFGTSSWFVQVTGSRIDAPLHFSLGPGREGATFALQSGCLAYEWAVSTLYGSELTELGDSVHALVNREVDEVPPGADNLLATHWLNGELPPLGKNAKALFLNLTTLHDRRHMVRAVMESVCYTHRRNVERYCETTGDALERITVVGGGAVSDVWMQMLADVLQRVVEVPAAPRHTGAMGLYYCAMIGLGHLRDYDAIKDRIVIERRYTPQPANAATYDRLFSVYERLYPTLRPLFDELNGPH